MEEGSEGGGWKLGMAFIATGIVFVLSCGVASVVYYTGSHSYQFHNNRCVCADGSVVHYTLLLAFMKLT